jgi:uncharacterized damage-inducible protein DinB
MRTFLALIVCAAIAGMGVAIPMRGGAPPQGEAAKSGPDALVAELVKDWQGQKKTMVDIAEAMPEDKFTYKATPAERNYGEQVMHVAEVNMGLLKLLGGKAAAPSFTPQSAKTKAEMIKAMSDSYDWGTELLKEQNGTTILEAVNAPKFLGPSTRARIVWFLMSHSMDIYGQMVVYLRLNGIVPPASRRGGV